MHDNIKKLLEGEKNLDELVEKSKDFSTHAKIFYKQSKKTNKCCQIFWVI